MVKNIRRVSIVTVALALLVVLAPACDIGDDENSSADSPDPAVTETAGASLVSTLPTLAEVYRRADDSLNQTGMLYHATAEIEQDAGEYSYHGESEQWVAAGQDMAREEHQGSSAGQTFAETAVILHEGRFVRRDNGEVEATPPPICQGASLAVSIVVGCPGLFSGDITTTVEPGQYEGRPAVVLVSTGEVQGSDERVDSTTRLYLDPDTFLPIASEQDGTIDYGQVVPLHAHTIYRSEFIPTNSVADGFFDATALGWQGVMAPLDQAQNLGVPQYWLGESVDPGDELPPLAPSSVEVAQRASSRNGYAYTLSYGLSDNRFGTLMLSLQVWPRGTWEVGAGPSHEAALNVHYPCHQFEDLSLPNGGTARIAKVHKSPPAPAQSGTPQACPNQPFDLFWAVATFGDTVVYVDAPEGGSGPQAGPNPYNSLAGMRAVVQGLHLRQP